MAVPVPLVCDVVLSSAGSNITIIACIAVGALFSIACVFLLTKIRLNPEEVVPEETLQLNFDAVSGSSETLQKIYDITNFISEGANGFLQSEYKVMAIFVTGFTAVIVLLLGLTGDKDWTNAIFSGISFVLGALTSIISGWIGMRIAVYSNGRTTLQAAKGYIPGFVTAFRGGIVMGFALTTLGLFMLYIGLCLFYIKFGDDYKSLCAAISAYGLGGSSIAMFGRVGGGIFTKAADVGADLVGKVEKDIPEDDPRNPGVIADCIGDNVGDIAGMGSDLFGSFAESTCAALVIASQSASCLSSSWTPLMYPLTISAIGIIVCFLTSFVATVINPAKAKEDIEPTLRNQLIISCIIASLAMIPVSYVCLPSHFDMYFMNGTRQTVHWWSCLVCVLCGLWSGLGTGLTTEYYTSNAYKPVQQVSDACKTGAATNIIYGLALGYLSVIIPTILLAFTIYLSYNMASVYGIALGALGILSTMSIGLTIDAYGPISDNAGGIAEMASLGEEVRARTDALDAAGNTTAAIGKGYAIGSAALVGLALYGAFITRAFGHESMPEVAVSVNIIDPRVYFGLLVGAMIPYAFSAMTMKSVGTAALAMVEEIRYQFKTIPGLMEGTAKPNYKSCVQIATDASLREMRAPGALVIITPIVFGIFLGPEALAGLLPGSLVSGVQMAISASNTGGAWDNAKKYIEAGKLGADKGKGTDIHKAAVIGDTVGDPLKDTSGPALNIVVKLMAIISVVFAPVFRKGSGSGGLLFDRAFSSWDQKDS